ncbi:MAG TPA: metal-dependent hydrolase [Gemmatimonadales bacterium]|nr:metal-dependent hydrolase [Gemmatimonadales bacterium]
MTMDNLAHALVGAALGRAVADRHVPRAATIGVIAANAPDWTELFIGLPGTAADFLQLHRGITHSLLGAIVQIIGLTLLIRGGWWSVAQWLQRRGREVTVPAWRWVAVCVGVTVLSHLYMDWQGSYGWRPFLPWSGRWYYLDWVAIADVFFWLVPLIGLAWGAARHWIPLSGPLAIGAFITLLMISNASIVAPWVFVISGALCVIALIGWARYWFGPVARQRASMLALMILALYAGAQGIVAQPRKARIRQQAVQRFGPDAKWAALTRPGRPFTWVAMHASADTVATGDWLAARHLRLPAVRRAIETTAEGRAMAEFARFLTAHVDSASKTIYLWDARFARTGREEWAALRVKLE